MGFFDLFRSNKKGKPPHTWYPDILHWKEGDEIYCWGILSALGFENFSWANYHKHTDPHSGAAKGTFYFKSVDKDGSIFVEDENGNIVRFEFYRFIRKSRNESLISRQAEAQVRESEEYMELIQEFQKAFDHLQVSDNPHLSDDRNSHESTELREGQMDNEGNRNRSGKRRIR